MYAIESPKTVSFQQRLSAVMDERHFIELICIINNGTLVERKVGHRLNEPPFWPIRASTSQIVWDLEICVSISKRLCYTVKKWKQPLMFFCVFSVITYGWESSL